MGLPIGTISINLTAIKRNWLMLARSLASNCICGAVVKADAYGLGAPAVVQALYAAGCRHFFVAHLEEALELRRILPLSTRIYVLQGVRAGDEQVFLDNRLTPVLVSLSMVRRWRDETSGGDGAACVVKINTGMNRFGLSEVEMLSLLEEAPESLPAGLCTIMSHLACADTPSHPLNQIQLQRFTDVLNLVRRWVPDISASLANSGGVYLGGGWCFSLVRPGIALYGCGFADHADMAPHPVVSVTVPVVQIRVLERGEAVGYGAEYRAPKDLVVAIVSAGYADGFFRSMCGVAEAWFHKFLPLLGRISMDSMVFDITELDEAQRPREGDSLELLGKHISVDQVAEWAGTSSYEVLTHLGGRLTKKYVENSE